MEYKFFLITMVLFIGYSCRVAGNNEIIDAMQQLTRQLNGLQAMLKELKSQPPISPVETQAVQAMPWNVPVVTKLQVTTPTGAITEERILEELIKQTEKQLKLLWDSFSWQDFKKSFQDRYTMQYAAEKAHITSAVKLTKQGNLDTDYSQEAKFLVGRMERARSFVEKFTNIKVDSIDQLPRIGCAFSGGGYRAMIATSGFMQALEDMKLLDGILYIAGLSGSTWFLGPWILQQKLGQDGQLDIRSFNTMLLDKVKRGHFNLVSAKHTLDFNVRLFGDELIWPKVIFGKVISSIDIYGTLLAHFLLADLADARQRQTLSNQLATVRNTFVPWPIYTAVSMHRSNDTYLYNWYEFNPEEIRNLEYNLAIPAFAFNRKFSNGVSVNFAPEESFGYLMGIFGSAFTFNLADAKRILFGSEVQTDQEKEQLITTWYNKPISWAREGLNRLSTMLSLGLQGKYREVWSQVQNDINQMQAAVLAQFLDFVTDTRIEIGGVRLGTARIAPAQVNNPFKDYTVINQPWLQARDYLVFIDAGIDYNIPLRPLLRPERSLDVVIVGDASGDVPSAAGSQEMGKALADIKRFYDVDYEKDSKLSEKTVAVYRPKQDRYGKNVSPQLNKVRPPIIIYLNFLKDEQRIRAASDNDILKNIVEANNLRIFSPENCINNYCGTLNFDYTPEQFKQLSGITEFNMRAAEDIIRKVILERMQLLVDYPEFGG